MTKHGGLISYKMQNSSIVIGINLSVQLSLVILVHTTMANGVFVDRSS